MITLLIIGALLMILTGHGLLLLGIVVGGLAAFSYFGCSFAEAADVGEFVRRNDDVLGAVTVGAKIKPPT